MQLPYVAHHHASPLLYDTAANDKRSHCRLRNWSKIPVPTGGVAASNSHSLDCSTVDHSGF